MDIDVITSLISTVGFPIMVCILCFWYIREKDNTQAAAIASLQTAVENNTKVMERIEIRLEALEKDQ